jgi:hypothetical protein
VFKKIVVKPFAVLTLVALTCASAPQSWVSAQRSIEQAADALLTEVLSSLSIQVTNKDLLLELSYEVQYALDAGIVDAETVSELDIEILDEELPDEELFEEDDGLSPEASPGTTALDASNTQLPADIKTRLQNRLALRRTAQVKYWAIIANDWATASQLAKKKFDTCLSAATTDEESDVCYFNEQQQLQFFFAQQLAENVAVRLNAANQLGPDVASMLNQSLTRTRTTIQDALNFMNAEELGVLGLTPGVLEDTSKKLQTQDSAPPSSGPSNSNPSNGQNQ